MPEIIAHIEDVHLAVVEFASSSLAFNRCNPNQILVEERPDNLSIALFENLLPFYDGV
ncbi:hypothetical protein D3C83_33510 [compost metagenome]